MKIDLKWDKPIRLRKKGQFYNCSGLERFSREAGVYVFARRHGKNVAPLYIGQAKNLRSRIDGQFNNLRLMTGVKQAQTGRRILLVGRLILHSGQQMKKVLDIVESTLIKRALAEGHDLINQHGTKAKVHKIKSKGNSSSRQIAPLIILVERKQGK
jgi:hypothetical protein